MRCFAYCNRRKSMYILVMFTLLVEGLYISTLINGKTARTIWKNQTYMYSLGGKHQSVTRTSPETELHGNWTESREHILRQYTSQNSTKGDSTSDEIGPQNDTHRRQIHADLKQIGKRLESILQRYQLEIEERRTRLLKGLPRRPNPAKHEHNTDSHNHDVNSQNFKSTSAVAETEHGRVHSRVLLVTIYRGGSTFLGEMFAQNPDCFYWFEPLIHQNTLTQDGSRMKNMGDVLENAYIRKEDGSLTMLPSGITQYRQRIMEQTLNCSVWEMSRMAKFNSFTYHATHMPKMQPYRQCLLGQGPRTSCVSVLERACTEPSIVAVKTIRLPLYIVRALLERDPELKVIYYVRDPRGVISSRRAIHHYTSQEMVHHGSGLCQKLKRDRPIWAELAQHFPQRVKHLRYEDIAANPLESATDIYRFIGRAFPRVLEQWIENNTESSGKRRNPYATSRNSTATASKWRSRLSDEVIRNMTENCRGLLDTLGYATDIEQLLS